MIVRTCMCMCTCTDSTRVVGDNIHIRTTIMGMLLWMLSLQWLEERFIPYLDEWEASVLRREDFSKAEKNRMLLSTETQMTGRSITIRYTCMIHVSDSKWMLMLATCTNILFVQLSRSLV